MPLSYFGLEITRRCNLRCPHCFTDAGGKAHAGPSTEALAELLRRLAAAGAKTVAFSGGEPLLRKDLEAVMRVGGAAGIESFTLVTNGFFAEPERVRSLKEAGLVGVQVSVDGVDARAHAAVRGCSPVDFYRALRAIRSFLEAGITVDVASIISRENVERAAEMALLCEALGVRSLRYCSFVPTGRAVDRAIAERFEVEPERLDRFLELLRGIRAQPDAPIGVLTDHGIGPWNVEGELRCDAGESVAYISAEGDLYPCPGSIFAPFVVGNVYRSSLEELLASPRLACVRSIARSELAEPCRSCEHLACSGGCRGAAFARTGDPRGAVGYCNILRRSGG
jgi:radical SAM protein with 4Fe4S-binding SPASM domain